MTVDAAALMRLLPVPPRILAVGEPTHGEGVLLAARNELFRTLVEHHNGHLQRRKSSMRMGGGPVHWWSAGALVDAHLGDRYAFVATALGTLPHRGVGTPPPDTVEGVLYAREEGVVDPRPLPRDLTPRVSPWYGYAGLDPAHLPGLDAILFIRDA